jgi:hypothetical protein
VVLTGDQHRQYLKEILMRLLKEIGGHFDRLSHALFARWAKHFCPVARTDPHRTLCPVFVRRNCAGRSTTVLVGGSCGAYFAKRAGYGLVAEFYDAAVSGADAVDSRPGFVVRLARMARSRARQAQFLRTRCEGWQYSSRSPQFYGRHRADAINGCTCVNYDQQCLRCTAHCIIHDLKREMARFEPA